MIRPKIHYPEVDALKGLAIFLVILGHAIIVFPVNLHDNPTCLWLFNFAASIHLALFFLLSGFVFSPPNDYLPYLAKKAKRILIPYLIFTLLDMIPRSFLGFLFNRPRDISESIYKMLFSGGGFWFLYVLFIIYLIFPIIAAWQAGHPKRKMATGMVLLLLAIMSKTANVDFLRLSAVAYFLFFFYVGFLFKDMYPPVKEHLQKLSLFHTGLFCFSLLALWIALLSCIPPYRNIYAPCEQLLRIGIALVGNATVWPLALRDSVLRIAPRFGTWTLQLYLLNGWTLGCSRYIMCNMFGVTTPLAIVLFNVFVDFGLSYLTIKYVLSRFRIVRFAMGIV